MPQKVVSLVYLNDKPMTMDQATKMFGYCPDLDYVVSILMRMRGGLIDLWNDLIIPLMDIHDDPLRYEDNADDEEDLFGKYWACNVRAFYPNFTGTNIRLFLYEPRENADGDYVFIPHIYISE